MNRFSFKFVAVLAAGLFITVVKADLAESNAINAAARAARESGDQAAYLANARKLVPV